MLMIDPEPAALVHEHAGAPALNPEFADTLSTLPVLDPGARRHRHRGTQPPQTGKTWPTKQSAAALHRYAAN